jgi:prophage maintenance system killer protein
VLFLEINGHRFVANEEDATDAVLKLAAGAIKGKAFAAWLRANVKRPGNKPR